MLTFSTYRKIFLGKYTKSTKYLYLIFPLLYSSGKRKVRKFNAFAIEHKFSHEIFTKEINILQKEVGIFIEHLLSSPPHLLPAYPAYRPLQQLSHPLLPFLLPLSQIPDAYHPEKCYQQH